jgi:hypothetical protein
MFWPYLKITLCLTIPVCTFAYANQLRPQNDCARIRSAVEQPLNIQWSLAHPREALQREISEARYLRRLLEDLDR